MVLGRAAGRITGGGAVFQLRVEGRRRGRSGASLLPSEPSVTRSAGDLRRGGASELELLLLLDDEELGASDPEELGRRFDEEDERDGGAAEELEDREEELRRSEGPEPLGRSDEPELGRSELELERFDRDDELLERSPEGRLELLLERRRLPSRDEDEDEEDEEEERRRATGVSQYGQTDQRGSTGLLQERHGSLSECWHSGQRSQSSSIGCSQRGHDVSLRRRSRSSDSRISRSRSRRSSTNSGGRRIV